MPVFDSIIQYGIILQYAEIYSIMLKYTVKHILKYIVIYRNKQDCMVTYCIILLNTEM